MLDKILQAFPETEAMKADGFDAAIIGVDEDGEVLVYSIPKCLRILEEEGMSDIDALEHFDFNILNAYIGDHTPIFIYDEFEESFYE